MSPATSTITFFQGPMDVAAAYLAKRVAEIVASNPWLASVLDTDPETGDMAAFVPRGELADAAQKRLFQNRKDISVGFAPRRGGEVGEGSPVPRHGARPLSGALQIERRVRRHGRTALLLYAHQRRARG